MRFDKLKKMLKRPRGALLAVVYPLTAIFCGGSIYFVLKGFDGGVIEVCSYVLYALSAVFLGYSVYTAVIYAPRVKRSVVQALKKNRFTAALLNDYGIKTIIFSTCSAILTVAFAMMNLIGAVTYKTLWYGASAAYYVFLIFFRVGIISADKLGKDKRDLSADETLTRKWRIYFYGGVILVPVELAMAVAVTQMILTGLPTVRGEILTIATATYTFYKISMAIYNFVKAHKFPDPVIQALRNVNLADACMSVVSLTVLMLSTFGGGELTAIKALTGFAVCASVIVMACIMMARARKNIKKINGGKEIERR